MALLIDIIAVHWRFHISPLHVRRVSPDSPADGLQVCVATGEDSLNCCDRVVSRDISYLWDRIKV